MVKFAVPEKIAAVISLGDPIQVEKGGSQYDGTITEVSSMIDAATGLFSVKGTLPGAQGLATGTTVKLSVVSEEAVNVMTVPVDTVYYEGGDAYVYTYEDGIIHKVPVEVGIYDSEKAEILSGLNGDDMVLTTWNSELRDGAAAALEGETQTDVQETTAAEQQ